MKIRVASVTLSLMLIGILSACSPGGRTGAETRPLRIACTFQPLFIMAANIVGDASGVSLECILPPNAGCPHDYSATPADVMKIEAADVLIVNGLGLDDFAVESARKINPDVRILTATDGIRPIALADDGGHADHAHDETHSHGGQNPHAWVSPRQAALMVRTLAARLGELNSPNSGLFISNAESYAVRLEQLHARISGVVERAPNRRIVTFHAVFDYLARDTGLEITAVLETEPGYELVAGDLSRLIDTIKREKPAALFTEPQYPARVAEVLSRDTGIPVYSLDSAASGPLEKDAYIHIMESNIKTLETALGAAP